MAELLDHTSEEYSGENLIDTILQERIARVMRGDNVNGHHPEPWLDRVLSGEHVADDDFASAGRCRSRRNHHRIDVSIHGKNLRRGG